MGGGGFSELNGPRFRLYSHLILSTTARMKDQRRAEQAMQVPEGRRTLRYTIPLEPSNRNLLASACDGS